MFRLALLAFLALTPASAGGGPQQDGQAVFERFLGDFTAADPDAVASHFTPEAMFWGTISRDLITTPQGVRQYFVTAFERLPGAKASSVGHVSAVQLADDILAVASVWRIDRMENGKPITSYSRNMSTLVKRNGRWMIAAFANAPQAVPQ